MESSKLTKSYQSIMIIAVIVAVLILAGSLVMPILFSGMIAILINPMADKLESWGIKRGIAAFLTVLIVTLVLLSLLSVIAIQSQEIVKELPQLVKKQEHIIDLNKLKENSAYIFDFIQEHITTIEENLDELRDAGLQILQQGITGVTEALTFLILCPIYVFFMLLCKSNIYNFIRAYHPKKEKENKSDVITNVKNSLYQYLKGLFFIMTISGTLTFIGLYFIGIEYALFLGTLTALLTPIPYIGVFISAIIPLTLALITKDSLWYAAGVLIIFAVVQFLEGYVFTPKIMGDNVNINPLIIVLGLIVFGSLTGIIGMIMTVPLLAILKVIIDYYPHLKPWKLLLEDGIT